MYAYDLDKHVLVCNKAKDATAMALLPYYVANINSGTHCESGSSGSEPFTAPPSTGADSDDHEDELNEAEGATHTGLSVQEERGLLDKLVRTRTNKRTSRRVGECDNLF